MLWFGGQGDAAVAELLPILSASSGFGAGHRIHALHALTDAAHSPHALPRVCEALLGALNTAENDARDFVATGVGGELDFVEGEMMQVEVQPQ